MKTPLYEASDEEIERIASDSGYPASGIRDVIPFIPPEIRPQWAELLRTDSRTAGIIAREYGWNPEHIFAG